MAESMRSPIFIACISFCQLKSFFLVFDISVILDMCFSGLLKVLDSWKCKLSALDPLYNPDIYVNTVRQVVDIIVTIPNTAV